MSIKGLKLKLMDDEYISKLSNLEVTESRSYDENDAALELGPSSLKLGAVSPNVICGTCNKNFRECLGHIGMIKLEYPVVHPCLRNNFVNLLAKTCLECYYVSETSFSTCPSCKSANEKIKKTTEIPPHKFQKGIHELTPEEIERVCDNKAPEVVKILGPNVSPRSLLIRNLVVPPNTLRPTIVLDKGLKASDDLTKKLSEIIAVNKELAKLKDHKVYLREDNSLYYYLCYHVNTYLYNKTAGLPVSKFKNGKVFKSLLERLETKKGLIRHHLVGKRVDYASRSTITADSDLKLNQVGICKQLAEQMIIVDPVTSFNFKNSVTYLENFKKQVYPMALYFGRQDYSGFKKIRLTDENVDEVLEKLTTGDVLYRQIITGDVVAMNRQPSLHKYSMMSHKVVVYEEDIGNTIRLNAAICSPYNADFDGDEMNLHYPQSVGAKNELEYLLSIQHNIKSNKAPALIIGLSKEALTGAYMMSKLKPTFDRSEAIEYLEEAFDLSLKQERFTYAELLAMVLPKDLTIDSPELKIVNGKILNATFKKNVVGPSGVLMRALAANYSNTVCYQTLSKLIRIFTTYHDRLKLSLVLADYPKAKSIDLNKFNSAELVAQNINNQTLACINELETNDTDNTAYNMATCGSSGSKIVLGQFGAAVGPKRVRNKTPGEYFNGLFPIDKSIANELYKKGIISGSYRLGLNTRDFLIDCMVARDSLIEGQVRIKINGYLARKLQYSLGDLIIENGAVVDEKNRVVQFKFGGDGVAPWTNNKAQQVPDKYPIGLTAAHAISEQSTQMMLDSKHYYQRTSVRTKDVKGFMALLELLKRVNYYVLTAPTKTQLEAIIEKITEPEVNTKLTLDYENFSITVVCDSAAKLQLLNKQFATLKASGKVKLINSQDTLTIILSEASFAKYYTLYKLISKAIKSTPLEAYGITNGYALDLFDKTHLLKVKELMKTNSNLELMSSSPQKVLLTHGIEAARQFMYNELYAFAEQGLFTVSERYLALLADLLTYNGIVTPIGRKGIVKFKCPLSRVLFESPKSAIFESAIKGVNDTLRNPFTRSALSLESRLGLNGISLKLNTADHQP